MTAGPAEAANIQSASQLNLSSGRSSVGEMDEAEQVAPASFTVPAVPGQADRVLHARHSDRQYLTPRPFSQMCCTVVRCIHAQECHVA
jgi:hypothetical protein